MPGIIYNPSAMDLSDPHPPLGSIGCYYCSQFIFLVLLPWYNPPPPHNIMTEIGSSSIIFVLIDVVMRLILLILLIPRLLSGGIPCLSMNYPPPLSIKVTSSQPHTEGYHLIHLPPPLPQLTPPPPPNHRVVWWKWSENMVSLSRRVVVQYNPIVSFFEDLKMESWIPISCSSQK